MNLETNYNKYKENLFYSDSTYLDKIRKNLIHNFILDSKVIKNNESLKHFDKTLLNNFIYNPIDINDEFPVFDEKPELFFNIKENKKLFLSKIQNYENAFKDDYLVNLNTIFHNTGFYAEFKKNTNNKFVIKNVAKKNKSIFSKNFFKIQENSNVMIIEKFNNKNNSNINLINYFEIGKNSRFFHLVLQENFENSNLQFTNYANCYENSYFKQVIYNASKSSTRNHNYVNLLGKNSSGELNGVFFGNNKQIIDNKTEINHYAPSCVSNQKYKGILNDQAKASYLSKTYVDKNAQKTEAYQLSKGILLSEKSIFNSKPELKIYADDVKCSHGSTIGPFDQNILFYMRSRGIPLNRSIYLLIKSFFSDVTNSATQEWWDPDEKEFINLVNNSINQWLENSNL